MIVTTDNTTDERRAYASGLRSGADVVEYWLADHRWWKFWLLPHSIRATLKGLREGADLIEREADNQDARQNDKG